MVVHKERLENQLYIDCAEAQLHCIVHGSHVQLTLMHELRSLSTDMMYSDSSMLISGASMKWFSNPGRRSFTIRSLGGSGSPFGMRHQFLRVGSNVVNAETPLPSAPIRLTPFISYA